MRASEINEGGRYLLAVTFPGTPRLRISRVATVVAKDGATVVVEILEQTCVNLDQISPAQVPYAMVMGELRYELRPVRRTVRAADLSPLIARPAPVGAG